MLGKGMKNQWTAAVLAVLVALTSSACDGGSSTGGNGARSACSTGPGYPAGYVFPFVQENTNYPACIARCGVTNGTTDALPQGACSEEAEVCSMSVREKCPCPNEGPLSLFSCRCTSGQWSCSVAGRGARSCGCGLDGGGGDGGGGAE